MIQVLEESNQIGIQFLRTELQTGNTLLDVAGVTDVEETRQRTARNARRAYDLVVRLMPRLDLSTAERDELSGKLDGLKRRLESSPM